LLLIAASVVAVLAFAVVLLLILPGQPRNSVDPAPTAGTNPIIVENQKPGSDAWKPPNMDDYLKNLAEESKKHKDEAKSLQPPQ
jgi:hypothetical protein